MDRRTPRSFRSEAIGADQANLPAISPALVEWLEREFPVRLSPDLLGPGRADNVVIDQAEQRGRQQVIERLRSLSNNQE